MSQDQPSIWKSSLGGPINWVGQVSGDLQGGAMLAMLMEYLISGKIYRMLVIPYFRNNVHDLFFLSRRGKNSIMTDTTLVTYNILKKAKL